MLLEVVIGARATNVSFWEAWWCHHMRWKMYLCNRSCRRSLQTDFCIIVRPFFFYVLTFLEALTTVSVMFLKPGFLVTVAKLYLEKVRVTDVSDYYRNPTHYLQTCADNSCLWTQITISDSALTAGCFIISHNCSVIIFPALTCSLVWSSLRASLSCSVSSPPAAADSCPSWFFQRSLPVLGKHFNSE